MKTNLLSLNKNKYPDITIECKEISNIKDYILQKCANSLIISAQKIANITARPAQIGEEIITIPKLEYNNNEYYIEETRIIINNKNMFIITNQDGETFAIQEKKFNKDYSKIKDNIFKPLPEIIKCIIVNENIVFYSNHGAKMIAPAGAYLNITDLDSIYVIQNVAFRHTYSIVNND